MATQPHTLFSARLFTWNANGLSTDRKLELANYMQSRDLLIGLLQETHLRPTHSFKLAGHYIYRTDSPRQSAKARGGTAIIVNSSIKHHEIDLPPLLSIEATGVEVQTPTGPLRLISAYIPPRMKLDTDELASLLNSPLPTIIAGDLNAKNKAWNSAVNNLKGTQLLRHSRLLDYSVAGPTEATHYIGNRQRADVLDIAVYINLKQSIALTTDVSLSSDHNPVVIEVGDRLVIRETAIKYCFERADWKSFQEHLHHSVSRTPITSVVSLEESASQLTSAIQEAVDMFVPKQTRKNKSIFDLPDGLKKSVQIKNAARRRWQKFRTPDLKEHYDDLVKKLRTELTSHRKKIWDDSVGKLQVADRSIWTMSRRLQKKSVPNPPIQGPYHLACSPEEKVEVLAACLEETFTPNASTADTAALEEELRDFTAEHQHRAASEPDSEPEDPCSIAELIHHAKRMKLRKAPGDDHINTITINNLPPSTAKRIVDIFNASMRFRHFPVIWKKARVVVFQKPGKSPRDPRNYRPISLLSNIAKLLERVLQRRLMAHISETGVLPPEQFGFREKHSTTQQLLRVTNIITQGFNTKKQTGIIFLDVAKAFDRVWHDGLLLKLCRLQVPPYLIETIRSFLTDRTFYVTYLGVSSSVKKISAGVPQGSTLSPDLFNIYTHDIPADLPQTKLGLYADDLAIIAQSNNTKLLGKYLQPSLDRIMAWYALWRIAINADKTKATLFTKKNGLIPPVISINGQQIGWEPSSVYLGVTLDSRLNFSQHVDTICSRAIGKLAALTPLFKSSDMSLKNKLILYSAVIRPTMTYASPVWSWCSPAVKKRVQIVQNRVLRRITSARWFIRNADIHRDLQVPTIEDFLMQQAEQLYESLDKAPNQLIRDQLLYTVSPWDRFKRPMSLFME